MVEPSLKVKTPAELTDITFFALPPVVSETKMKLALALGIIHSGTATDAPVPSSFKFCVLPTSPCTGLGVYVGAKGQVVLAPDTEIPSTWRPLPEPPTKLVTPGPP